MAGPKTGPKTTGKTGSKTRCALAALLLLVLSLPAWARDWRISDYHASIAVDVDGEAVITERITAVFIGEFHGLYRYIPIEYPGPRGSNYTLFLKITGVTDELGRKLKYESRTGDGQRKLKIYVPGAVDTTKTVLITYATPNAIRFFDDHDEFYWNVTGNDWPVPIDHASAVVSLPVRAAGGLRAQAFTGVYGSYEREATVNVAGSRVDFETTNPLPMRGGLTIDVYIPKGVLAEPSSLTRTWWFIKSNPIIFLPVLSLVVMFSLWWGKGRDPEAGLSVAPMYEPPKEMSPAEAGTLLDDSLDPRDLTSTLIDLAVRGYIKIEEKVEKRFFHTDRDYVFHLLKPSNQWQTVAPHERVMMENIFGGGQTTSLSSLKNRFYKAVPVIKQDIFAALRLKGMYTLDPDSANTWRVLGVLIIAAPFVIAQVTGIAPVFSSPLIAVIAIGLSLLIVWLFGRELTAKTLQGVRTRVAILGFQEFMNRVDADRLKRMPPDTFEKYLPYAMALGVEHHWAQAFAGLLREPPRWYVSPDGGMFNPVVFTNSLHGMSNTVHETFVSSPRASSSGSGFGGGGGFSGGGFGGGGGGAF